MDINIGLLQASYLTRGKLLLLNEMYEELMIEDSTLRGMLLRFHLL